MGTDDHCRLMMHMVACTKPTAACEGGSAVRTLLTTAETWVERRRLLGLAADRTAAGQLASLRSFAEHVGPDRALDSIARIDLESWAIYLIRERGNAASTVNLKLTHVRTFFGYMQDEAYVARNPCAGLRSLRVDPPPPRAAPTAAVVGALGHAPLDVRVIILLGVQAGLRRAEIAGLRVDDWDPERRQLLVRGKGGKARLVSCPDELVAELEPYLVALPPASPWLFPAVTLDRPVRPETIWRRVVRASTLSGEGRIATHQLRHAAAKGMLANGASLPEVAQQLGHSSVAITGDVYGRATDAEIASAAEGRRFMPARPTTRTGPHLRAV